MLLGILLRTLRILADRGERQFRRFSTKIVCLDEIHLWAITSRLRRFISSGTGVHDTSEIVGKDTVERRLQKILNFRQIQAYASILRKFGNVEDLSLGKQVHHDIVADGYGQDRFLCNCLIELYGKCGALQDARSIFDKIHKRNLHTWNITISTYAKHGFATEALKLFHDLHQEGLKPDKFTFSTILSACASMPALTEGKIIHAMLTDSEVESNNVVSTALIIMYSKHGNLEGARRVFKSIHERDKASWSAIVAACAQHGDDEMSLWLFQQMQMEKVEPDSIAFASVLGACANLATLAWGKKLHSTAALCGLDCDGLVGNALVNMYGKCGNLEDAKLVFDRIHKRDVVSWSAMIYAYAQLGHVKEALELFLPMQLDEAMPNAVTFINILSACSHAGLVEEGCHYLVSMELDHHITLSLEHYGCMIDLYGRAGQLEEAECFIIEMPLLPNVVMWETLLGACKIHSDVNRGLRAADHIMLNNATYAA